MPLMARKKTRKLRELLNSPNPLVRILFVLGGITLSIAGMAVLWVALTPIPDLDSFVNRKVALSTKIYDRTGEVVLYDLNTDVKRQMVPLNEISPFIQEAAISIEDSKFYEHGGVSFTGMARALIADIMTGRLAQGGSTITQQVVKLTLLTNEKSIIRKVHEIMLAIKLEGKYTKEQILELYLNNTPYGGTLYGVEAASRAFFAKSALDVTLPEAAYLAALPQSPTYFSPYGNHKEALDARKNLVLGRMLKLGYINQAEYDEARNTKVTFSVQPNSSILAPHFVFYIREYLEEKYGADVVTQGLTVITTLDAELQHEAESIVNRYALENEGRFNASNAALVALDPKTGQILSMVGSRDYFDPNIDGNYNATLALRQPGSSFKPFVYATALAKGYTPQTAIFDLPTQFSTACGPADNYNSAPPCYAPGNYDDKFRGPMTFTTALAQSINIPAVKTLYLAGVAETIALAKSAGITTLGEPKQYGLTLALGAAEVRLLEITNGFATFANNGIYNAPTGLLKVTDKKGKVLEEFKQEPRSVIDAGVVADLSSMLSNNAARVPSYSLNSPLHIPGYDVAAKTGTTNDYRDTWTIGYTPTIAVGVWAGNNDNSAMNKETAGFVVAPMWNAFMQIAIKKLPKEFFPEPRPLTPDLSPALRGLHNGHDILHWVNKDNPRIPGSSSMGDQQYVYWEYPVGGWAMTLPPVIPDIATSTPPIEEVVEEDDEPRSRRDRNRN